MFLKKITKIAIKIGLIIGLSLAAEMLFQYLIRQPYAFNPPQPNP